MVRVSGRFRVRGRIRVRIRLGLRLGLGLGLRLGSEEDEGWSRFNHSRINGPPNALI